MITKLLCFFFHTAAARRRRLTCPVYHLPPVVPTVVPEPSTYFLMGLGLLFVAVFGRKFKKQA
jgi:hypothetical protein